MNEKNLKYGWNILLIMLWVLLLSDFFYRVVFFPVEVVAMHDYFYIVAFPMTYYFSRKRKDIMAMKGSMIGLIFSLVAKFGFMAGSILMWK